MAGVRFQVTNSQEYTCFMPELVSFASQPTAPGCKIVVVFTEK